eukprot:scaffold679_cov32-Tisochrysis_lutea.AAC.1
MLPVVCYCALLWLRRSWTCRAALPHGSRAELNGDHVLYFVRRKLSCDDCDGRQAHWAKHISCTYILAAKAKYVLTWRRHRHLSSSVSVGVDG